MLRTRSLLTALAAVAALMVAAGSAGAASFTIEAPENISMTSLGTVRLESNVFGIGIECEFAVLGELHSGPIEKVEGALIGYINSIIEQPHNCSGGSATILENEAEEAAWHITYNSITGTLPEAVETVHLLIHNAAFLVEISGVANCLYRADQIIGIMEVEGENPYTSGLVRIEPNGQRYTLVAELPGGFFACPTSPTMTGTFEVTPVTITRS